MKHKKFIKQLMAMGIQRNDAAGFVKASRILTDKGMSHLLPAPLCDPLPVIVSKRDIRTCAVQFSPGPYFETAFMADKEKKDYIKRVLATEMSKYLLDSGLCKIQAHVDTRTGGTDYRATIDVAVPQEVRA